MLAWPVYAQIVSKENVVDHNDLDEDFAMLTMKPLSHGGDIVDLAVTQNDGDHTLFIERDASDHRVTQMGDVKLSVKQSSSDPICQYVASVSDKQGRTIEIEGTAHKLVVQIVKGKHRQVLYRNSVFDAEETLGLMGQFFVEAENNQDEEDEEQTTGLVHVGSDMSHGGRTWLLESHDLERTQSMFQKQVNAMLADEHSNLVPLASAAMLKTGIDVNSFFCSRPFHTFASIVGKTKLRKKDLSFIEAWERSVINLNATRKTNSSAVDAGGWDGVSGHRWDSNHPRRPYSDCGSDYLGQCGLPGECWETASGCPGCGCMRGCEYHDHYCTCTPQQMSHHVCFRMSFGGWEHCGECVGPGARERDSTRRRRFYD